MARFTLRTRDEMLQRMVARVVARSRLTDLADLAVGKQILAAVARELEDIYDQAAALLSLFDLEQAEGQDLDDVAAIFSTWGFPGRRGAVKATTSVTLTRNAGAAQTIVPLGTVVAAAGTPDVQFELTAQAIIAAGAPPASTLAAVQAKVAGTSGNVGAATVTKIVSSVPGLDACTNPVAFSNGLDEETDSEFRSRIWQYLWALASCTPWALEIFARSIGVAAHADGVAGTAVKVFETTTATVRRCVYSRIVEDDAIPGVSTLYIDDGTGFAGVAAAQRYLAIVGQIVLAAATGGERRLRLPFWPITPAAVTTVFVDGAPLIEGTGYRINRSNGWFTLSAALVAGQQVTADYTCFLDLVRAVQYAIEGDETDRDNWPGRRGSGDVVFVRNPSYVPINVVADLTVAPGKNEATAIASATSAVQAYLSGLGIGEDVIYAQIIEEIMAVDDVIDVSVTTPVANRAVPDWQKATAGTVTIS